MPSAYDRPERLAKVLARHRLDAFVCTRLSDIRYLTGFTGSAALLVFSPSMALFFTDGRYDTQARDEIKGAEIFVTDRLMRDASTRLDHLKAKRVGYDPRQLSVDTFRILSRRRPDRFIPLSNPVEEMRMVKDQGEIRAIEAASVAASAALLAVLAGGIRGRAESEVAADLVREMKRMGADDVSFPPIVASGVRGAMPHAGASPDVIDPADFVTVDFGARRNGYCSDETVVIRPEKTIPVKGKGDLALIAAGRRIMDLRLGEALSAVLKAQEIGIKAIRPGTACREVDRKVRAALDRAGFLKYFVHSTGHGVGLDIHERPTISPRSNDRLAEGMVATVEPGVYLPGIGGVRVEDTVRVTSCGAERITYLPKANLSER